jgi:hypothetical protein
MIALITAFLLAFNSVDAGSLVWQENFTTSWTIGSSEVTFTVTVSGEIAAKHDWWAVGLGKMSTVGTIEMDTLMIAKTDETEGVEILTDMWCTSDDPVIDVDQNLTLVSHTLVGDTYTTVFTRPLNTGDKSEDMVLVKGMDMRMMMSYGPMKGASYLIHDPGVHTENTIKFDNTFIGVAAMFEEENARSLWMSVVMLLGLTFLLAA